METATAIKIKDFVFDLNDISCFFPEADVYIIFYTTNRQIDVIFDSETERNLYYNELVKELDDWIDIIDFDKKLAKKTTISEI